jgi:hypothetical protein
MRSPLSAITAAVAERHHGQSTQKSRNYDMTGQSRPLSDAANDNFLFHSGLSVTRIGRGPEPVRRAGYARLLRTCGFVAVEFD